MQLQPVTEATPQGHGLKQKRNLFLKINYCTSDISEIKLNRKNILILRNQHFMTMRMRIRKQIQGFDDQTLYKNLEEKILVFFIKIFFITGLTGGRAFSSR
jgi:hypothetical protein